MKIEIKGQDITITTSDDVRFYLKYSHVTELLNAMKIIKAMCEETSLVSLELEV